MGPLTASFFTASTTLGNAMASTSVGLIWSPLNSVWVLILVAIGGAIALGFMIRFLTA